jgi:hypothetical protein
VEFLHARTPTHSPLDVKTRGALPAHYAHCCIVHALVLLAAGLALFYGESTNLTWLYMGKRSGLEMYTVSCATSSLLPRRGTTSSRRVGFARCSPSTISTTPRTSLFPNPRGPLVSEIVSLGAQSQVAAAASCLCLLPGYDGANMVHPLAWPTYPLGFSASPQRAGRWSPWTPETSR